MIAYGNITSADLFFANRLFTFDWDNANIDDRQKAISHATMLIDQFAYIGDKYSVSMIVDPTQEQRQAAEIAQPLEFPRGDSSVVPSEIEHACYLIAQALLSGRNPDMDLEGLANTSVSYGGVRTNFDRSEIMEHVSHLIPSPEAFNLLRPFFRRKNSFYVKRV